MFRTIAQRWHGRAATAEGDRRVEDLRAGDARVIEQVLTELLPFVRGWIYRRLGPDAAIDDVTQEALTEIARALPSFEGRAGLAAYAYRISTRVVSRHLRRRIARRDVLRAAASCEEPWDGRDPEQAAIERQALRSLLACLQRLPARRREVFILCEIEGATPHEAAALLGTTPNAVRSRLMHARRELDRRLSGNQALMPFRGRK